MSLLKRDWDKLKTALETFLDTHEDCGIEECNAGSLGYTLNSGSHFDEPCVVAEAARKLLVEMSVYLPPDDDKSKGLD